MSLDSRRFSIPVLILLVLIGLVSGAIVVAGVTADQPFDVYNPDWEGFSEIQSIADDEETDHIAITSPDQYADLDSDAAVVIPVTAEYDSVQQQAIRQFVEDGGTAVVAGRDPTITEPVLRATGSEINVSGSIVRDDSNYWRSSAFPEITDTADHPYTTDVDVFTLNYGTVLQDTDNAQPIANTSSVSYLDQNNTGDAQSDDEFGPHPVVAVTNSSAGTVVAVSDPSVFINTMLERDGNEQFVQNLVTEHDQIAIDQTNTAQPVFIQTLHIVQENAVVGLLLGLLAVGAVVGWERQLHSNVYRRIHTRFPNTTTATDSRTESPVSAPVDPEALRVHLAQTYPELTERQRERILDSILNVQQEDTNDG